MNRRIIDHLNHTFFIANLMRLIFLHRCLTARRCNVRRTPLQFLRGIKRKRIHKEWATKKKWRRRHGITLLSIYRAHRREVEERYKKELLGRSEKMIYALIGVMEDMEKTRNAGR